MIDNPRIEDVVLPPTWGLVNGEVFGTHHCAQCESQAARVAFLESALREAQAALNLHNRQGVIVCTLAIIGDDEHQPNLAKWLSEGNQ